MLVPIPNTRYPIPSKFFTRTKVVQIARELLGMVLITESEEGITAGRITETEAYEGLTDKASHSHIGRRTARTETMFLEGGHAYVYLCYGIHHLFNIITAPAETPHAVLIRAVEPLEGIDLMLQRRGMDKIKPSLTAGPGSMSKALGINKSTHNATLLQEGAIRIEDWGLHPKAAEIVAATRVGVAYAQEDAYLPYRFFIKDNIWVSKGKGL